MAQADKSLGSVRFGPFELLLDTQELRRNGVPVKLSGQAIQVLFVLVARPGKLVTREELKQILWSDNSLGDFEHGLNAAVNKLREKLGDSATEPTYIETLPGRGYRFIGKIESTEAELPLVVPAPRYPTWAIVATLLGLLFVAGGVLYQWLRPVIRRQIRITQQQRLTVVPLTALPGKVASPTLSPDGSQVAFAWDGGASGAGFDLYVKTIGSETVRRITQHPSVRLSAAWSPDGRNIAISRIAGAGSGIYLVAPTGGPERRLVSKENRTWYGYEVSWSPDGKYLAFIQHPADSSSDISLGLYLLSLDTLTATQVKTGCLDDEVPSFSPQGGGLLAWVCSAVYKSSIRVLNLHDGRITQLLERRNVIDGIAWSLDGRHIVFSDLGDLWELYLDSPGQAQKLPIGHDATDIAVSPAGHRLAYAQGVTNINIWRIDLSASPPSASKVVTSSRQQLSPSISPDGSKIAFESNRSGSKEIWICNADGSDPTQLTFFGGYLTSTPRWSPDGKLIAFDSRAEGEANLYLIDPSGGPPRKIDIDVHANTMASWSRDGKWIYFQNGDDISKSSLWKAPPEGGHAVQIAQAPAMYPIESPDGIYVYFSRNKKLWRVRTDGSALEQVRGMPEMTFLGDEWFPFGGGIYFMAHSGENTSVKFLDLVTEKIRTVYELQKPLPVWLGGMPVSNDGRWLLFPQVDHQSSDLMLVENWR